MKQLELLLQSQIMGYKYSVFRKWGRKQHEGADVNHITATVSIQAFSHLLRF